MNNYLVVLLIGISLSMDAFSLALVYGTYGILNKDKIILSLIVGIYHFIMPILGNYFGNYITKYFIFKSNLFLSIVFFIIGIDMIISSVKNNDNRFLYSIIGFFIFGFSVSIDSFTTGIGISAIGNNYLFISIVFMLCSAIFTYMGLILGNSLNIKYGKYSTIIGGIMLLFLSIYYMFI